MQKDTDDRLPPSRGTKRGHKRIPSRSVISSQIMIASALASNLLVGATSPALTSQSNSTHVPGAHRKLPEVQLVEQN